MSSLLKTLDIRPVDNIACNGKLIEVFRGGEEKKRILGQEMQETHHFFVPGKIGGNHWHREKIEIFYVALGEIEVYLDDLNGQRVQTKIPIQTKFTLVPGIPHALTLPQGLSSAYLIEYSNLAFNPDNPKQDVYSLKDCLVTGRAL